MPASVPDAGTCVVEDVTLNMDGTTTRKTLPKCGAGGTPCWRVVMQQSCTAVTPQGTAIVVDRGGQSTPPNTVTAATCSTQ